MKHEFYVNSTPLSNYGVYWDGSQLFDKPSKDVTFFSVPGRNGDLFSDNQRFNNINITIKCYIKSNFVENFENLTNFLYSINGYAELTNTQEPNYIRLGQLVDAIQPQTEQFNESGAFELVFNCQPQKYIKNNGSLSYQLSTSNISGMFPRSSEIVQQLFSKIPALYIPNDEMFIFMDLAAISGAYVGNFTQINASWSGGNDFFMLFTIDEDRTFDNPSLLNVIAYDNESLVNKSVTIGSSTTDGIPYIMFGFRDSGTVPVTLKFNGTAKSRTYSAVDIHEIGVNGATGNRFKTLNLYYSAISQDFDDSENMLYLYREVNGELVATGYIKTRFDRLGADGYSSLLYRYRKIYSNIGVASEAIKISIDLDQLEAVIAEANNLPEMNINDYVEIVGDLQGIGRLYAIGTHGQGGGALMSYEYNVEGWRV